jgi:hypothetical protein
MMKGIMKRFRALLAMFAMFAASQSLIAAFSYVDNNPTLNIVPYGSTFTYSVTWSGANNTSYSCYGTGLTCYVEYLTVPAGQINYDTCYPSNYTFTYTITSVAASDSGTYWLGLNPLNPITTTNITLYISPAILTQPTNTICISGSSTTMGILAGPNTATFQWFNAATQTSITGTSTSPSFTPTTANSGETIYCKIYNTYGQVTSSSVLLTVGVAPSITLQPTNITAVFGSSATFSVTVASATSTPLYYQWYKNGLPISGANLNNIDFSPITIANLGTYQVVITNLFGTVTSSSAALSSSVPAITSQPSNVYAVFGSNVTFSVTATGTQPLYYQWYKDGEAMQGANLNYIYLPSVTNTDAGIYAVIVSNELDQTTSSNATLNVGTAVSIISQPTNLALLQGQNATFTVSASGSTPYSYQWKLNCGNITHATNSIYTINGVTSAVAGTYTVLVSNYYGSMVSSNAILTVYVPPSITQQPVNQSIVTGSNATFSVVANGTATLTYQWTKNNTNLSDGGNTIGSSSNLLALNPITTNDTGPYTVIVTNNYGSVTSSVASLLVGIPPQTLNIFYYQNNSLILSMTGTPGFPYGLQETTNLTPPANWQSIGNIMADTNGLWSFTDTNTFIPGFPI